MEERKKMYDLPILAHDRIAKDTFMLRLDASSVKEVIEAGSFFHLKLKEDRFLLRRPISVYEITLGKELKLIYKILGEGTRALSEIKAWESLNVLGPLGTGFPIQEEVGTALLVGGGVGVPPLYELGKRLKAQGRQVVTVLGFRDEASVFAEEDFKSLGPVYLATDDGSRGIQGTTLDAIRANRLDFAVIYACGPKVMLRALDEAYAGKKQGWLSFEERMACGIGACYGCMQNTKAGLKRVCKDGPVFALGEAIYE